MGCGLIGGFLSFYGKLPFVLQLTFDLVAGTRIGFVFRPNANMYMSCQV